MKLITIRKKIDKADDKLLQILSKRIVLVKNAGKIKRDCNYQITDLKREKYILQNMKILALKYDINERFILKLFKLVIKESKRIQSENQ